MLNLGVAFQVSPKYRAAERPWGCQVGAVRKSTLALSTFSNKKLAIELPLLIPGRPVLSLEKLNVPDPFR